MWGAIAFGLAFGAGFQALRNYPADRTPTGSALLLVMVIGIVCAYCAGRGVRSARGPVAIAQSRAKASAKARSEASSQAAVQVNLWQPAPGQAEPVSGGTTVPDLDRVGWLAHRQVLEHEDIDGMDLAELVEAETLDSEDYR